MAAPTRRRFLRTAALSAAGLAVGGSYAQASNSLTVHRSARRAWGGGGALRVGLLADLHAPNFLFDADTLVAEVNAARCDVLAVAGDTIDRKGHEALASIFGPMRARLGKWACLGNREVEAGADLGELERVYDRAGVRLLVNDEERLEGTAGRLRLVGLDDLLTGKPAWSLAAGADGEPRLILMHCPAAAETLAKRGPRGAVVLSGHTHGGQIAPFGVPLFLPAGAGGFVKGWYDVRGLALHVSPGLGNTHAPVRIGVPPTLSILDLS